MAFPGSVRLNGRHIYRTSTVQIFPLGTRGYMDDGRVFRYTKNGATALTVGSLIQQAVISADHGAGQVISSGGSFSSGDTAMLAKFSTDTTGTATMVADNYKEGYLFFTDGSGEGMMVQIASHEAGTTGSSLEYYSTIQFMDYAELTTGGSTGSTASNYGIIKNLYDDVIVFPTAMTGVPVGITPRAVAANAYFWMQTWGIATCKVSSTDTGIPAVGFPLMPATVAGDVARPWHTASTKFTSAGVLNGMRTDFMAAQRPILGTCVEVGADGETGLIDLKLAP